MNPARDRVEADAPGQEAPVPPRPDAVRHAPEPGALRLLGDGRSAALLGPRADVLWWCSPDLDDDPLLWGLLDVDGPAARLAGALPVDRSGPPAGPALRTEVRVDGHRVGVHDGLLEPDDGSPAALVRLLQGRRGPVALVHELSLGGWDGADPARWDVSGAVATARAPGTAPVVVVVPDGRHEVEGPLLRTHLSAGPAGAAVVITSGTLPPTDVDELRRALDEQADRVEEQVGRTRCPEVLGERARDALRVLGGLTSARTGAVVASPTTSLPEAPGHDRQFDYRYCWLRDSALSVSTASLLGEQATAAQSLRFLAGLVDPADPFASPPVVTLRGDRVPDERDVAGVAGWAGTTPVRVGNAAGAQAQVDALAWVVEAVSVHVQTGGALDDGVWAVVVGIADAVADEVLRGEHVRPTAGVWELREPRVLVSEDVARWLALSRALVVARGWRPTTPRYRWRVARDRLRDRVVGALRPDGLLPQAYDDPDDAPVADAISLSAVVFGLLDGDDPRAARLVDAVIDRLGTGSFLLRYLPGGSGGPDDGFSGVEGAFVPMSWWAVAALAVTRRTGAAELRARELDAALPRLMGEQVDPTTGGGLGNAPLLWSHASAARALYVLDAERRRARYGSAGLAAWRLARYVRLRTAGR